MPNLTKIKIYLKRILITLLVLLLFSFVTIKLGVAYFLKEDTLKQLVVSCCQQELNRKVVIEGDIHLKVFPNLVLEVERLSISEKEAVTLQRLSAGKVKIKISLFALLWKKLEIKEMVCENFDLKIKALSSLVKQPTEQETQVIPASTKTTSYRFIVDRLSYKHFNVYYTDLQNHLWFLEDLNLDLSNVDVNAKSSTVLEILKLFGKEGKLSLKRLAYDAQLLLDHLNLEWTHNGQRFEINKLTGDFEQQRLLQGTGTIDQQIKMTLGLQRFDLSYLKRYNPNWVFNGEMNGTLEYTNPSNRLDQLHNGQVTGNVQITDLVWGNFNLEKEIFKKLVPVLPVANLFTKVTDSDTLLKMLKGDFSLVNHKELAIKQLSMQGLTLHGEGVGLIDLEKLQGVLQLQLTVQKLGDLQIPLTLSGSLQKPHVKINLKNFKFNNLLPLRFK